MPKISNFIIGIIVVSLIITLFNVFLSGLNVGYSNPNYSNETLAAYNKLNEIKTQTEKIENKVSGIQENPNVLDVIGGFFTSGYTALKLTFASFDTFDSMINSAATDTNLGQVGWYLKISIGAIVIVLLMIGVVISAIMKWGV